MARRKRSTKNQNSNTLETNNQVQNNVSETSVTPITFTTLQQEEKNSFWDKFNNVGGITTVIIGIFGAGFGAGVFLNSIYNRIDKMEIDIVHQKEMDALKKEKYMTKEDMQEFINNYNKANDGSKE